MKRLLTLLLIIVSANVFGQLLPAPSGTLTPLSTNQAYVRLSDSTYYFYNGTNYLWNYFLNKKQADKLYAPISGGAYVPLTRTLTINGSTRDLSANRIFNVGTVLSVGSGYGLSGGTITSSGTLRVDTTAIQTIANFFPKGDTRYARTGATGTVTSVGLTMPVAFSVANSPVTTSGTLAVSAAGNATQYIRGDGELATLPSGGGGGSAVNYYMNGSVAASVATYKQMANTAVIGAGTDFPLVGNGLIAQFLTDVANPNRLLIPSGAWNFEMYFSVSSSGGSQKFYVELLKYDGATFTSIANSSAVPEAITGGTTIDLYLTTLAVPETVLLTTDRLAVRVYVVDSSGGRTTTLHTEDSHLCLAITTFAGGISALNGLTDNTQYFAVGSTGTDFNISSVSPTHTFNIPSASASNRGVITTGTQTIAGDKTFSGNINANKNIHFPVTSSTQGFIEQESLMGFGTYPILHTYSGNTGTYSTNTFAGFGSGNFTMLTDATNNSSFGANTLQSLTTGSLNTAIGSGSGGSLTTGSLNSLLGRTSGVSLTTGSNNTFIGTQSGAAITTGSGNIIIGSNIGNFSTSLTNNIVLASGAGIKAQHDGTNWAFTGGATVTGQLTLNSTITNGTYTYTLPSATGTLALTSALGSYLPLTGGTLTGSLTGTSATFSGAVGVGSTSLYTLTNYNFLTTSGVSGGGLYMQQATTGKAAVYSANNALYHESVGDQVFITGGIIGTGTTRLTIASTGAATFSSSISATSAGAGISLNGVAASNSYYVMDQTANAGKRWRFGHTGSVTGFNSFDIYNQTDDIIGLTLSSTGAATFSSTVTTKGLTYNGFIADNNSTTGGGYFTAKQNGVTVGSFSVSGAIMGNTESNLAIFAETGKSIQFMTNGSVTPVLTLATTGAATFSSSVSVGAAVNGRLGVRGTTSDATAYAFEAANSGGASLFLVKNDGVSTFTNLAGTGSRAVLADASGNLSAPVSDISVKQNIKPIGYGLKEIVKMNPVWFDFIDGYKNYGSGRQNGNIAQEMAEIIPEAVFITPSTGKMGINYDQLHAVYIKAIQELKAEIDILKAK